MGVLRLMGLSLLLWGCGANHSPSVGRPFGDASVDEGALRDVGEGDDRPEARDDVSWAVDAGDTGPATRDAGPAAPGLSPYPFVLVHGFAGFREVGPINYFYNVADDLRRRGETVYEVSVAPFAPPAERAPMLATQLQSVLRQSGRGRLNLIAHSQGGLDCRYLISTLGWGDRVASLTTVSTPHRGTRLADALLGVVPGLTDGVINTVATVFGFAYTQIASRADLRGALVGLSERESAAFNAANPDDPRVLYFSYAGRSNRRDGAQVCQDALSPNEPTLTDAPFAPLGPLAAFLEQGDPARNANDGLVTVQSARWGTFVGCVAADHFDEVGQIAHRGANPESGFDHILMYRDIARRVRDRGL
ncbi:MAG: triacylglycerol lipase [Myxococcales bacterium]|nr:triacylglycerol lipase [Myxococcales bacterium]